MELIKYLSTNASKFDMRMYVEFVFKYIIISAINNIHEYDIHGKCTRMYTITTIVVNTRVK